MNSARSVRVAGPGSLAELVEPVRRILGLPEGEFDDSSWSTGAVSVRPAPVADYDYVVLLDGSHLADPQARRLLDHDREARQIFYSLANTTPWALCLLDHVGAPRVQRPAVVPTNQA